MVHQVCHHTYASVMVLERKTEMPPCTSRPSYYLNEQGQCRNPARLANDLLTGLKDHGFIEQAANQAAAFNMEDESEE